MSAQTQKIVLAVLSFVIPIVGIVLFFIYKPKKDAQLFGVLGILGLIIGGVFFL